MQTYFAFPKLYATRYYMNADSGECAPCLPGTYTDSGGGSCCNACPMNTFASGTNKHKKYTKRKT